MSNKWSTLGMKRAFCPRMSKWFGGLSKILNNKRHEKYMSEMLLGIKNWVFFYVCALGIDGVPCPSEYLTIDSMRCYYKIIVLDCCRQMVDDDALARLTALPSSGSENSEDATEATRGGMPVHTVKGRRPLHCFWAHSCRSGYTTVDGNYLTPMMSKFFKLIKYRIMVVFLFPLLILPQIFDVMKGRRPVHCLWAHSCRSGYTAVDGNA